jgi:archaellum biogenesis ATPase FlaH
LERVGKELVKMSQGRMAKQLNGIIAPEKQLMVMIVGNHSAGKSS